MMLAYGGRMLSNIITPAGSSQAVVGSSRCWRSRVEVQWLHLRYGQYLKHICSNPLVTAQQSGGPIQAGLALLTTPQSQSGRCAALALPGTRLPSLPTAKGMTYACVAAAGSGSWPRSGKCGAQRKVHSSSGPRHQGSAYLLLHKLLSQHWWLFTPRRRGIP